MASLLEGRTIAILATDGVEQSELSEPRRALEEAGARTQLIGLACGAIQAVTHGEKADRFAVDTVVADSHASTLRRAGAARRRHEPGHPAHGRGGGGLHPGVLRRRASRSG